MRSEIAQDHPTVVLKLNHIKFDLVPAITSYVKEYRIPAPSSSYQEWVATSPNAFNTKLAAANTSNNYKLKPAIRLLKYWNALADYVYDSYAMEQSVADKFFFSCSTTKDYFFACVESLTLDYGVAQWRKEKLDRAKRIVAETKRLESEGYPATAEEEIKKLIP